jgi:hypothetical protein
MLKAKKSHYVDRSHRRSFWGVEPSKNDDAFKTALDQSALAEKKLEKITSASIMSVAKMLLQATRLFDGDEVKRLQRSLETVDSCQELGSATKNFLSETRGSIDLGNESPEALFINAVWLVEDAVNDLFEGRYVGAQANTVRCRASLQKVLE